MNTANANLWLIGIVVLILVGLAVVWFMGSRSRRNPTVWLMGLGAVIVIALGIILYTVAGGRFDLSTSKSPQPPPTSSAPPTSKDQPSPAKPSTPAGTARPSNKWQGIESAAKGLLPDCLKGAGLDNAWDYMSVSDPVAGANALVAAFLLMTPETATRYKGACGDPVAALGVPKDGDYAYVVIYAQALRDAQLDLGQIAFVQDEKKYIVPEYLMDDQRLPCERWIARTPAWSGVNDDKNFPRFDVRYLRADLTTGVRTTGLLVLPTGIRQGECKGFLDAGRSFELYYGDQEVVLSKP